jgi:hypothetical protein
MLSKPGKGVSMTIVIILNVILCGAVIVGVVAPLVWAIVTPHRDEPSTVVMTRGTRRVPVRVSRRGRRRLLEPIVWPVA